MAGGGGWGLAGGGGATSGGSKKLIVEELYLGEKEIVMGGERETETAGIFVVVAVVLFSCQDGQSVIFGQVSGCLLLGRKVDTFTD